MRRAILLVALAAAGGCFLLPKSMRTDSHPERDLELYHIQLIRPGMTIEEADRIVHFRDRHKAESALAASAVGERCAIAVEFTPDGKVAETRTDIQVTFSFGEVKDSDDSYLKRVHFGMLPAEVEQQIGAPKYGYENVPGTVVLLYDSRPGLELTYVNGKVESWRKTRKYQQGKFSDEKSKLK